MATQAELDAAAAAIISLLTDLSATTSTVLTDITAVQGQIGQGVTLDATALDSAVSGISSVQTALDDAVGNLSTVANPTTTTPPAPGA